MRTRSDKVGDCIRKIEQLRQRIAGEKTPTALANLRMQEDQWLAVLQGYQFVAEAEHFPTDLRSRQSAKPPSVLTASQ